MLRRAQIVLWVSFMQEFSEILEKFCILRSCDWLKIETYLLPGRLEGTFLWHLCTLLRKQDRILAVRNQIQSNLVHPIKQKLIQKNYDTHQKKYMWYHFTSTSFHWTHSKKKRDWVKLSFKMDIWWMQILCSIPWINWNQIHKTKN